MRAEDSDISQSDSSITQCPMIANETRDDTLVPLVGSPAEIVGFFEGGPDNHHMGADAVPGLPAECQMPTTTAEDIREDNEAARIAVDMARPKIKQIIKSYRHYFSSWLDAKRRQPTCVMADHYGTVRKAQCDIIHKLKCELNTMYQSRIPGTLRSVCSLYIPKDSNGLFCYLVHNITNLHMASLQISQTDPDQSHSVLMNDAMSKINCSFRPWHDDLAKDAFENVIIKIKETCHKKFVKLVKELPCEFNKILETQNPDQNKCFKRLLKSFLLPKLRMMEKSLPPAHEEEKCSGTQTPHGDKSIECDCGCMKEGRDPCSNSTSKGCGLKSSKNSCDAGTNPCGQGAQEADGKEKKKRKRGKSKTKKHGKECQSQEDLCEASEEDFGEYPPSCSELQELELSEYEELVRYLQRWHLARRHVVSKL